MPKPLKIVIVEDDLVLAKLLELELSRRGYQVRLFVNALSALSHLEFFGADLVITDIFLPDLDGIDLIRAERQKRDTPIIAMSSQTNTRNVNVSRDALRAGASYFLSKPIDLVRMHECIKNTALLYKENRLPS